MARQAGALIVEPKAFLGSFALDDGRDRPRLGAMTNHRDIARFYFWFTE